MNNEQFIKELNKLNITINSLQQEQLEKYYNLLINENKKYNLTAITDKEQVYLKHFYDSLTISMIYNITNQSICDIGTGAGFPGIVLKIIYPNIKLTLIESNQKKCNYLKLLVDSLDLDNVIIINQRAEDYSKLNREQFDIVTSRAVAPLKHLLEYSIPLVKVNGYYIAMKSNIEKEIIDIENYYKKLNIKLKDIKKFNLPIENSQRTLLLYQKLSKTDTKYPRKYSEIKKKEL